MSSTNTASMRKCPVCDAPNSNLSIFCAECGASLNAPESDNTAAYKPIITSDDDAQQTAAFEPGSFTSGTPSPTQSGADATGDGYRSTWEAPTDVSPTAAGAPVAPVWSPTEVTLQSSQTTSAPQGIRGFVLGLLAILLILTVFLLWTWATLLDQGTRDSIRDFFGFIG